MMNPAMHLPDPHAGFFGKVRSHGDFVGRRLPAAFTRVWDDWLQAALRASREQLGPAWLSTYLNSPIWRFVLAPGACGPHAWAGVLMPSVDRVGRHFPLTIAAGVAGVDSGAPLLDWTAQTQTQAWYDSLETLALSSLLDDFSLDTFDATLRLIAAPPGGAAQSSVPAGFATGRVMALASLDSLGGAIPQLTREIACAALEGHSVWWTQGSQEVAPCVLVHRGLPGAHSFTALLDGQWRAHGWRDSSAQ